MAILLTPVIYLAEQKIVKYLGFETAHKMKLIAMGKESDS
jgi:hypothetical protein